VRVGEENKPAQLDEQTSRGREESPLADARPAEEFWTKWNKLGLLDELAQQTESCTEY